VLRPPTIVPMTVERMDHVGVVVDDLEAAVAFFVELGLEVNGTTPAEGEWVDRIVGLTGVRVDTAMLQAPDGSGRIELVEFDAPLFAGDARPEPANVPGLRHLAFQVDDIADTLTRLAAHGAELVGQVEDYGTVFRLCYVRGPAGMIVELAERLGRTAQG
jgi:catechol 2,3-dioxygenase-like lactoylglutathione lyase family enzyme